MSLEAYCGSEMDNTMYIYVALQDLAKLFLVV